MFKFPWTATKNTPVFTGIPPHVVMMSELESFKVSLKTQTENIVSALKSEMDTRGVGGDGFQARIMFEDMKTHQETFFERMDSLISGVGATRVSGSGAGFPLAVVGELQNEFIVAGNGEDVDGDVDVSFPLEEGINLPKGLVIEWKNCEQGRFCLVPKSFKFPVGLTMINLFTMFFIGDKTKNIPPYRMLSQKDLFRRTDKTNLSMMKRLMKEAKRGAEFIVGKPELTRHRVWTHRKVLDFYEGVKHLFDFPGKVKANGRARARRFSQLTWKRIFLILQSRRYKLMGEQHI